MSYVIAEHIPKTEYTNYAIFKTSSYEWSEWHPTLHQAIQAMLTDTKQHSSTSVRDNTIAYLRGESHLQLTVIPELLSYRKLLNQYPEIFL